MTQMSRVNCKYGAPMGRGYSHSDNSKTYKFHLFCVRLDSGGYDNGGAYWGIGDRLYCVQSVCGEIEYYFRAYDRKSAKWRVGNEYPRAKFFR